jgi:hypothetical protein
MLSVGANGAAEAAAWRVRDGLLRGNHSDIFNSLFLYHLLFSAHIAKYGIHPPDSG